MRYKKPTDQGSVFSHAHVYVVNTQATIVKVVVHCKTDAMCASFIELYIETIYSV